MKRFVCAQSSATICLHGCSLLARLGSRLICVTCMHDTMESSHFILFGMIVVEFYEKVLWN